MVSNDGGATWRNQPTNLPGLDLHTFAASPTDPTRLYTVPVGVNGYDPGTGPGSWLGQEYGRRRSNRSAEQSDSNQGQSNRGLDPRRRLLHRDRPSMRRQI